MKPINWRCPHCEHFVTITDETFSSGTHFLALKNSVGRHALVSRFFVCPNIECRRYTLHADLYEWSDDGLGKREFKGSALSSWRLKPWGDARTFPSYVPTAIREDYEEACAIASLSPKAAATLARRAVQGADSTPCRAMIPADVGPVFHSMPGHRSTASRAG